MKFKEIVLYPDRVENIKKYNNIFNNSKTMPAFGELLLSQVLSTSEDYFGLFNQQRQLVSILHLNVRDHGLWQITYTQTESDYQGQGCFRYLLTKAVATHGTILSDENQTNSSKKAWQGLIKYPGPNLSIFTYNTTTHEKNSAVDYSEDDIWNNKTIPVLMITSQNNIESDRDSIMKQLKENTGIDRTEYGIWYGPNTSNGKYLNP